MPAVGHPAGEKAGLPLDPADEAVLPALYCPIAVVGDDADREPARRSHHRGFIIHACRYHEIIVFVGELCRSWNYVLLTRRCPKPHRPEFSASDGQPA